MTRPSVRPPLLALLLAAMAGCAGTPSGGGSGAAAGPAPATGATLAELLAYADSAMAAAEPDLARRALDRAASMAPDSADVWVGYGRYDTATLRYKDAKDALDRAAKLDPTSPAPPYYLGVAYLMSGDANLALAEFANALRIQPGYAPAVEAIQPILEQRYVAAGIPGEYASFPAKSSLSRGELGVALAVELGADPARPEWRSGMSDAVDAPAVGSAWGSKWLRASVERGWIEPYPDGSFHLDDPVTRGALAIVLSEIATHALSSDPVPASFPDLGPHNYLDLPAARAVTMGLPRRDGGRFEAQALATGQEALDAIRGLARALGASPVVSGEAR